MQFNVIKTILCSDLPETRRSFSVFIDNSIANGNSSNSLSAVCFDGVENVCST